MIEASASSFANLLGSFAGFRPILLLVILGIFLWEAVVVLSAVIATVGLDRQRDQVRRR